MMGTWRKLLKGIVGKQQLQSSKFVYKHFMFVLIYIFFFDLSDSWDSKEPFFWTESWWLA